MNLRFINILSAILLSLSALAQNASDFIDGGITAYKENNYNLAKYFHSRALTAPGGDDIVNQYICHNQLRDINRKSGLLDEAIADGRKCIDIFKAIYGANSPKLVDEYLYLAYTYAHARNSEIATAYIDSARLCIKSPDTDRKILLKFEKLAGLAYNQLGEWQKSADCFRKAMEYNDIEKVDNRLDNINLYGNSLYHLKDFKGAHDVYLQQMHMARKYFGEDSKQYQWAKYIVANILAYMGEITEGGTFYSEVAGWYRDKLLGELGRVPSSTREAYLADIINILRDMVPFGIEAGNVEDSFTLAAYENLLLAKGLLLASDRNEASIIRTFGSDEDKSNLADMLRLKSELALEEGSAKCDPARMLALFNRMKAADAKVSKAAEALGNITSFSAVGFDSIRNSLTDNEVILDFADFKPASKPRQFVCFEVRRNMKYPRLHLICEGNALDSLLRLENNARSNLYTGDSGKELERLIASRIKGIAADADRVYYVPSGDFHKLSIEAIPDGNGILGERYDFRRLSSARMTSAPNVKGPFSSAAIFGNLDYGVVDRIERLSVDGKSGFNRIPMSGNEIKTVESLMDGFSTINSFSNKNGTKQAFMELSENTPEILHLSTHGFYYSSEDPDIPASLKGYDDAMTLSGLIMADGNHGWLGVAPSEGIMTAEEIAGCDMSGNRIVFMASCFSGEGKVSPEGIYGLQRAFKKAGSDCIIMNMWQASDNATACFVESFYKDLLHGSRDRHQAFRHARDEVRRIYPEPFYWAGFIMVD